MSKPGKKMQYAHAPSSAPCSAKPLTPAADSFSASSCAEIPGRDPRRNGVYYPLGVGLQEMTPMGMLEEGEEEEEVQRRVDSEVQRMVQLRQIDQFFQTVDVALSIIFEEDEDEELEEMDLRSGSPMRTSDEAPSEMETVVDHEEMEGLRLCRCPGASGQVNEDEQAMTETWTSFLSWPTEVKGFEVVVTTSTSEGADTTSGGHKEQRRGIVRWMSSRLCGHKGQGSQGIKHGAQRVWSSFQRGVM